MRVTAGNFKGREVKTVDSLDVRPTLSKIRESIFNIIQGQVYESRMLDLFAGSGIIGIEAASRGAKEVLFVEKNPKTAGILKNNLKNFDFEKRVLIGDAIKVMDSLQGENFDIIFADPPYQIGILPDVIKKISENHLLSEDGILIIEHPPTIDIAEDIEKYNLNLVKQKKYGDTVISIVS